LKHPPIVELLSDPILPIRKGKNGSQASMSLPGDDNEERKEEAV
jgi:hypothetical protein